MLKHKQTQFEAPKLVDGEWEFPPREKLGNCFATCVACLLELPLEQVPNFVSFGDLQEEMSWWPHFIAWLAFQGKGYSAAEIPAGAVLPEGRLCILSGKSPRGEHHHSVVGKTLPLKEGVAQYQFIHDPSPHDTFIDGPVHWVTLIFPIENRFNDA